MIEPFRVYDPVVLDYMEEVALTAEGKVIFRIDGYSFYDDIYGRDGYESDLSVEFYTGKGDKDDQPIYHKDTVKFISGIRDDECGHIINFGGEYFIELEDGDQYPLNRYNLYIEVTGTTHD